MMRNACRTTVLRSAWAVLWLGVFCACAGQGAAADAVDIPASDGSAAVDPAEEIAQFIDQQIALQRDAAGVPASPLADDAEFLRRLHIDLLGRIPAAADVRRFEADTDPHKRRRAIDELIASPGAIDHATALWRARLIPEAASDQQLQYVGLELEAWLRIKLAQNVPYDQMVRELLSMPLKSRGDLGPYMFYSDQDEATPSAFYAAKNVKPENLAAATARLFLGLRVDCAQCHDHPFAEWRRDQFWAFAAYFQDAEQPTNNPFAALANVFRGAAPGKLTIVMPETGETIPAAMLDGAVPENAVKSPRASVAQWVTDPANKYFSQAIVNWMWADLFGIGLVDPVDDLAGLHPPSHPELLAGLAERLVSCNFDLRVLQRGMLLSTTYQLSSKLTDPRQTDATLYARRTPKKMTAAEIYDSVLQAMGERQVDLFAEPESRVNLNGQLGEFVNSFGDTGSRTTEAPTAVVEALTMMNGHLTNRATHIGDGPLVSALTVMPGLSDEDRIESLFLATLSRRPDDKELSVLTARLSAAPDEQRQQMFGDILWALLNCSEFALNH